MKSSLLLLLCVVPTVPLLRAQKPVPIDEASLHQQLRDLKATYETAINSGNLAPLETFFDTKSSGSQSTIKRFIPSPT